MDEAFAYRRRVSAAAEQRTLRQIAHRVMWTPGSARFGTEGVASKNQESKSSRRHPSPAVWGRGRRPLRGTSKRPSGERASPSQTGGARGSAPRNLAGTAEQAGFAVLEKNADGPPAAFPSLCRSRHPQGRASPTPRIVPSETARENSAD